MEPGDRTPETWHEHLRRHRARFFVGRASELRRALALFDGPDVRLLHVCGAAGIGKSSFAHRVADLAREAGRQVRMVDAGEVRSSRSELARAIGEVSDLDLLVVDSFDALGPLESWLRESLLPALAEPARVVTAGRAPLSRAWTDDPGWRSLTSHLKLAPLTETECRTYLERREIEATARERIIASAGGWPLALGLLADASATPEPRSAPMAGALAQLVETVLDDAPSRAHAAALHAGCLVRTLTAPLLGALLEEPAADELFRWLEDRSFATRAPSGLRLHAALAETLLDHLQRTAPESLEVLRRRAIAWYANQLRAARLYGSTDFRLTSGELVYDAMYTVRDRPIARSFGVGAPPTRYVDGAETDDRERIAAAVEAHEGPGAGAICRRWLDSPETEAVLYRDETHAPRAAAIFVPLEASGAGAGHFDPVVSDLFAGLDRTAPLRPGERVMLCRHWLSLEHGQRDGAELGLLFSLMSQRLAFSPGVQIGAAVHIDPDSWIERPDLTHELLSRTDFGDVALGVLIHDWRKESPSRWFHRYVRALAGDPSARLPPPRSREIAVLDRSAFEAAVRKALRQLTQPERLCDSPLARAPLAVGGGAAPGSLEAARALAAAIEEAIDALDDREGHGELLRRSFLGVRQKQLAVAADLDMGFSTYRRHLKAAVERLIERLWSRDLRMLA